MTGSTSSLTTTGWPKDDGPPPLVPGEILTPSYRVVAHLRRGNHLDVYDVWSEERGCRCVAKALRPDCDDGRAARRLAQEGRLLARLAHPHLVRAYETVRYPRPVVILETLPGETLAHLVDRRRNRLPTNDVAHLGLHLCSAVGYLHRHGILHLDLKPSNVVACHGIAKVIDLSVASKPGPTRGGIGTAGYMAPEQAHGGLLGPATDVWGIGAVLYEVATGEPPLEVADSTAGEAQLDQPAEPIRRHRRVPAAFASLVDACLRPEPGERPTVEELAAGLRGLIASAHPGTNGA